MIDSQSDLSARKNRLLWRCRQGTRELELLLYRYANQHYDSLSEQGRIKFESFLTCDVSELNEWLLSANVPEDNEYFDLIQIILSTKRL